MAATAHLYEIFIRAPRERVWQALVDPDDTVRYFHGTRFDGTFEPGGEYRNVIVAGERLAADGRVEVFEPPHRLVLTWQVRYDPAMEDEPPGRVEWTLTPANADGSVTRVTLRHGDLARSPLTWEHVRLGWVEILDGLKTLLETGEAMPPVDLPTSEGRPAVEGGWHRSQAVAANNAAWELLDGRIHRPDEVDQLLERAYAAAHHWRDATDPSAIERARASWLLSRVHATLGHGDLALHHADRCSANTAASGDAAADFDHAYAAEARARALACAGRLDEARIAYADATSIAIADDEDRAIVAGDLAAEPWYGLERPGAT